MIDLLAFVILTFVVAYLLSLDDWSRGYTSFLERLFIAAGIAAFIGLAFKLLWGLYQLLAS